MKDMEQVLLNNTSIDELIRMKIEEEFKPESKKTKEKLSKNIYELKEVPKDCIFSKKSIFRVYNRKSKNETLINGVQADAMIGIQAGIREKILDGELTTFSTDEAYVKFEKAVL